MPATTTEHAALGADFDAAFAALRAAGLEADADHPTAVRYRAASDAVNHSNRAREAAALRRPVDRCTEDDAAGRCDVHGARWPLGNAVCLAHPAMTATLPTGRATVTLAPWDEPTPPPFPDHGDACRAACCR